MAFAKNKGKAITGEATKAMNQQQTCQAHRQKTARQGSALAQKELQAQVSATQSLTLVKNLIRVSISTVCYLRDVFPKKCYQKRAYAGMDIYQLDAATRDTDTSELIVKDQEAYDLTMWLESGVLKAVELRYLRRMEFIIMCPDHENPREVYSFDFSYPDGQVDATVILSGGAKVKISTVESAKSQLCKLIRSLITFGHTLGELPKERVLNIKLWYFDDRTPPGWQPEYFREADPSEFAFKKGRHDKEMDDRIKIKIGDLQTPHHTLSLRFTGYDMQEQAHPHHQGGDGPAVAGGNNTSGGRDDGSGGGGSRDNRSSEQGSLLTSKTAPREEADDDDDDEQTVAPEEIGSRDVTRMVSGMMSNLDVSAKNHAAGDRSIGNRNHHTDDTLDNIEGYEVRPAEAATTSDYAAAKAWALTQTRPTLKGLEGQFKITKVLAREFLERMVHDGLFIKRNYTYHRVSRSSPGCDMDVAADREGARDGVDRIDIGDQDDDDGQMSSSQASSASDDSETQAPDVGTARQRQLDRDEGRFRVSPSSMPPPAPTTRVYGNRVGGRTPDSQHRYAGDFTTPPIPKTSSSPGVLCLQPVPEKPPREALVTMGTKRVLDDFALGDHDDEDSDEAQDSSKMLRDVDEPIDMFNPEGEMGSDTGYERLILSQASSTSASQRAKRKCSLAINPILQNGPSKRPRVTDGGAEGRG